MYSRVDCTALRSSSSGASGHDQKQECGRGLRRDVSFVWNAVIAVVFIGFASLAVAAALLDLVAIRH